MRFVRSLISESDNQSHQVKSSKGHDMTFPRTSVTIKKPAKGAFSKLWIKIKQYVEKMGGNHLIYRLQAKILYLIIQKSKRFKVSLMAREKLLDTELLVQDLCCL